MENGRSWTPSLFVSEPKTTTMARYVTLANQAWLELWCLATAPVVCAVQVRRPLTVDGGVTGCGEMFWMWSLQVMTPSLNVLEIEQMRRPEWNSILHERKYNFCLQAAVQSSNLPKIFGNCRKESFWWRFTISNRAYKNFLTILRFQINDMDIWILF